MADRRPLDKRAFWIGVLISVFFLAFFFWLQYVESKLLALPIQYLVLAAIPAILGLVLGGFVSTVKAGDYELGFSSDIIDKAKPIDDPDGKSTAKPISDGSWQQERTNEYQRTSGYMLVHVYRPSRTHGQKFDISIFIVRHQKGTPTPPQKNLSEIEKAEFFFGESWGNKIFTVSGEDGFFAVRTHAWGTFLATCRVTFKSPNQTPMILHRYIDFSMLVESDQT
jgi:hypothetical protein